MRARLRRPRRRAVEAGARALLRAAPVAILELDRDGVVRGWNLAAEQLLGWAAAEIVGCELPASILGRQPDWPRLFTRLQNADSAFLRLRCRGRGGRLVELECRIAVAAEHGRRPLTAVVALVDVTERNHVERRLRYQAQHDALTQLPNRETLISRLERTLAAARRSGHRTGLLMIDLDGFKEVNDTFGHAYGDRLLAQIGPRLLTGAVRDNDVIARLSGDEFAVLLPDVADAASAEALARGVLACLHTPFPLEDTAVDISASIGVAVVTQDAVTAAELMRHADAAMYEAKQTAVGVVVYEPSMDTDAPTRVGLLGQLRRALDNRELVVYYQPQVELGSQRVSGAEALVRWNQPGRGMVPPGEFIPVAETTGLMSRITEYVLADSIAQVKAWLDRGIRLPVSVNLSARNLHDRDLPRTVRGLLRRHNVPVELLRLEITESAVMHNIDSALVVLGELVAAGITLSLDDYGTGYSSMGYLQRLPVAELKIDQSFVGEMVNSETDASLVRSTIELAHRLSLEVVAEGIEDAATVAALRHFGCDIGQGYHFGRPMPAAQFDAWLAEHMVDGTPSSGRPAMTSATPAALAVADLCAG